MFVNTLVVAQSEDDLPFKHSDVECLLDVGFLGNHDHWVCSLNIFGEQPVRVIANSYFFACAHPFHLCCIPQ